MASVDVRVHGPNEVAKLASLKPADLDLPLRGNEMLTVLLDIPASPGGATVDPMANPGLYVTIPPNVTVMWTSSPGAGSWTPFSGR